MSRALVAHAENGIFGVILGVNSQFASCAHVKNSICGIRTWGGIPGGNLTRKTPHRSSTIAFDNWNREPL